jgi:succinate dehydrogenase flavin-adding protein (antitoxin of CptAB toxin-antitoxin module)
MATTSILRSRLETDGYALIQAHMPEAETIEATSRLGSVLHYADTNKKQVLTPQHSSASTPNTYSGNYGCGEFPFHTDLAHWSAPPRYLALRCIVGTQDVATFLVESDHIISEFGRNELKRTLVQPRRTLLGKRPLLRLLDVAETDQELFRWDMLFTQPATEYSKQVVSEIGKYLSTLSRKQFVLASKGDTMIVDNWRMIHGRTSVNQSSTHRRIERVYMNEVY